MIDLDRIKSRLETAVPGARLDLIPNGSASGQVSLLVDNAHAVAVATWLRDDPELRLDYASNVTGVDWPEAEISEKVKVRRLVEGVETEVEEIRKDAAAGLLEVVYHLYSMENEARPGDPAHADRESRRQGAPAFAYPGLALL